MTTSDNDTADATPPPDLDGSGDSDPDRSLDIPTAVRELLDADGSAVAILDLDGQVRSLNDRARDLLGAKPDVPVDPGSPSHDLLHSMLDHAPRHLIDGTGDGTWQGDIDRTGTMGDQQVFRATVVVRRDDRLPGGGFIGLTAHDVTFARTEATDLRHRATHDPLTGLANRRQILATLSHAIGQCRGGAGHVAAVFIDVDRLKYVNDALGHQIGDRLLVSAGHRLADTTRPQDHVARIGGDEFLVVCTDIPDAVTALDLAERIRRALTGRLRVNQLDLQFSVSIGVALSDDDLLEYSDNDAAAALISNADTAMYEAKSAGRSKCVLFTSHMRSVARQRTELSAALSHAIAEQRLTLEFQPVFSAVSRKAVGAEALVRWHHPTLGRIAPAVFVSVAEESGAIGKLGEFVLEQALVETRRWIEHGVVERDFAAHVNVAELQLAGSSFVNLVLSMLKRHRLRPENLVLETREQALLGRDVDVDRSVRALRRFGVRVAIDNFGTGANALSVLTDVGADILKLDGSLALPSGSTDEDLRVVRAVVLLAHALDMRVVAERVSGVEQLRRLRTAGCDDIQGNLLAEPAAADRLVVSTAY